MKILVWQWGRFGAGPRIAADFARALGAVPGVETILSLAADAEILHSATPPDCALPVETYTSMVAYLRRAAGALRDVAPLAGRIRALAPDLALCVMPGPLDLLMDAALRRARIPYAVIVHDADLHPGDGYPFQMQLQRRLVRRANAIVALSGHVADRLAAQGFARGKTLLMASLPPASFPVPPPQPRVEGETFRLLSFGRLLPYKGLDLLEQALSLVLPRSDLVVRVVGQGPETPDLARLRALPGVTVENRWVPEDEVAALLAWSHGLILTHREASQSGVAAVALGARRRIVSTRVGGLVEQLGSEKLALLCDPEPASIAASIVRLLEEEVPSADSEVLSWTVPVEDFAEKLGRILLA